MAADDVHPATRFLEPHESGRWIMPATGGLHPFTLLVLGLAAVMGILFTQTLAWLQVLLVSTVVFLMAAILTATRYRMLVINAYEVIVLRTRALRTGKPVERLGRAERSHPFEVRGTMWGQILVGSEKLWVHRRYHADLAAADKALAEFLAGGGSDKSAKKSGAARAAESETFRSNRAKKKIKHVKRGGRR